MKRFWLNLLLWTATRLTSDDLIEKLRVMVALYEDADMSGREKRDKVLEAVAHIAEPFARHLVNLALEVVVAWTRAQLGKAG